MSNLTVGDQAIIQEAIDLKNPGIFTNYYLKKPNGFKVYPGTPRHERFLAWMKENRAKVGDKFIAKLCDVPYEVTIKQEGNSIFFHEDRGYIPLPWHVEFYRVPQKERYVIGLAGSGKTMGIGVLALFMCATIPDFKFMNVAPSKYQSSQMINSIVDIAKDTPFLKKFLKFHGPKWYVSKPAYKIEFLNGSTAEFMNVDDNADNIQSSYGDWYNLDEAGLLDQIDENGVEALANVALGIISRMRATAPDGRPRLGWMSWISNAYDCDTLWDNYEAALIPNDFSWGRLVRHTDNPYLTAEQMDAIRRKAAIAGKEAACMEGERPQAAGSEISAKIVDPMFDDSLNEIAMAKASEGEDGWRYEQGHRGIIYETPARKDRIYMIAGDPGTGQAPDRNAPTIIVWDVTDFPMQPAVISAVWWSSGGGSYLPFITKFEELIVKYKIPEGFRGYDSTGTQKAMAELSWESRGISVVPMGFDGAKKWMYLNALRLILSKGLMKSPRFNGIRQQLVRYRVPDKKIAQDIVATICMGSFMLYPLYRAEYPEYDEDGPDRNSEGFARYGRDHRASYNRQGKPR